MGGSGYLGDVNSTFCIPGPLLSTLCYISRTVFLLSCLVHLPEFWRVRFLSLEKEREREVSRTRSPHTDLADLLTVRQAGPRILVSQHKKGK